MNNDIAVQQGHLAPAQPQERMTVEMLKNNINIINTILGEVMQNDVHYGIIPGTPKPTLYQPGAETILATFRCGISPIVEDLSGVDYLGVPFVKYRITANVMTHSGVFLGAGVGEASSLEEKYAWRKAICMEEFNAAPETMRRTKYAKGQNGVYQTTQIRTNPADSANTILKMAKKRAMVDAVKTAFACSAMFTQDVEDDDNETSKPQAQAPAAPKVAEGVASEAQIKAIRAGLSRAGIKENMAEAAAEKLGIAVLSSLESLTKTDASKLIGILNAGK